MSEDDQPNLKLSLRRNATGALAVAADYWGKRWFRRLCYAATVLFVLWVALWTLVARDLPDVAHLKAYQPPLPTTVRAIDGSPVHTFARERRVQLSYADYPKQLVDAYLAAEDHNFFSHGGIDYQGILVAAVGNLTRSSRAHGASTITQQVVKNLLLTSEQSYTRKLKEAILAKRIESVLTKQQILELYLNQIFLGRNAYGVQAASRSYFGKDVKDLTLAQSAFLAVLPKSPTNFNPDTHMDRALERRAYVLKEMLRYKFIDQGQYDLAMAEPLQVIDRGSIAETRTDGYFMEEVRRDLIDKFGENSDNGRNPYSVYGGGLWVRTSYNAEYQKYAEEALRDGLVRYDRGHGWSGPVRHLQAGEGWETRLSNANMTAGYPDWKVVMLLAKEGNVATIGFADGSTTTLASWAAAMPKRGTGTSAFNLLVPGDCIAVKAEGGAWVMRNVPEVSGGMAVEDPHTGRVLAMQGGFDSQIQSFNRATQAMRQPGSSFKPFVYATALDHGMTPATILIDGPFCVFQSVKYGKKCFKNFGGGGGSGPHTMRWGVEQSRNLMTVRAASESGMDNVVKMADAVGISEPGHKFPAVLAVSLGAGETTVSRMVNAYSILASNGRATTATLIDFVQDRTGKVIYRADERPCVNCNMPDWDGKPMPRPAPRKKQAMDAQTAYQTVHIMEGVIKRGTAVALKDMGRPLFGKTGTTTGPKEVWFVGGSADLVAGVYIGFDTPRDMGGYAQGGTLAVPIFKQFAEQAMENMPVVPFRGAPGIRMVRIDRASGRRVFGAWPSEEPDASVIWEAFKPSSEPTRSMRRDEQSTVSKAKVAHHAAVHQHSSSQQSGDFDTLQKNDGIY
jgi:penicillin-binding protein 1A